MIGFIVSIISIICSFIPVVGIILAIFALILSIVSIVKNKESGKLGLKIAGIVISSLAFIIGMIMFFVTFTFFILNSAVSDTKDNIKLTSKKINIMQMENNINDIEQNIDLYIAIKKLSDKYLTNSEIIKNDLLLKEETNIVYNSNAAKKEGLDFTIVALKDSGVKYYKINSEKLDILSDIHLNDYVMDEKGNVYFNAI